MKNALACLAVYLVPAPPAKPAGGEASEGFVLRLREVAGRCGPARIGVKGYKQVVQTDLLERDREKVPMVNGEVTIRLKPYGFCALRLLP